MESVISGHDTAILPVDTPQERRKADDRPLAPKPSKLGLGGTGSSSITNLHTHPICITYKVRERGVWRTARSLDVDPSDPSEVERVAMKYMRKQCFEAATANGSNTILLIAEREIEITEQLIPEVPEAAVSEGEPRKRERH
ncbi:hypothetical protein BU23DRAFT_567600 [Bimuria novae-zelandiae CBS 107.79]|uniref:Uncharacterized protein n=1 Tax=Bimuria novae-zelandiae CBS 107.79 TaxID=1447943 RepID=A0A6A5VB72_9PLEO|nr:hypothetical protein BU23DRAFT_567600 [Bimuria novae-zelandiae CBS 107.79]